MTDGEILNITMIKTKENTDNHKDMQTNTVNKNQQLRRKGKSTAAKRSPFNDQQLTQFYKNTIQQQLFPTQTDATVGYSTTINLTAANPYYAYPLRPNAAYDIDPSLGSTATQGLQEMAALYGKMRVLSYSGEVDFVSIGIYPTEVTLMHTRIPNGVTAGGANVDLTLQDMNPMIQRAFLGHSYAGTGKHTFTFNKSISDIVGNKAPLTDDLYESTTTGVPSEFTYLHLGAKASTGNASVVARVRLFLHVRFTDRKLLTA